METPKKAGELAKDPPKHFKTHGFPLIPNLHFKARMITLKAH